MSKTIQKLLLERVTLYNGPYLYMIRGVYGSNVDMWESAHITLRKLSQWSERFGAEVNIVEDRFRYNFTKHRWDRKGLLVEITDPVSKYIDELLCKSLSL